MVSTVGHMYETAQMRLLQVLLAWVGSFLSLLFIGGMQQWINQHWSIPLLLATFGPATALVFGLPSLPASQPVNCLGKAAAPGD